MKIIKIIKNDIETNSATFETIEELNEWKEYHIINNTFGLPERPELIENENGEMIETGNILPSEYEIVIEDISSQIEYENKLKSAMDEIAKGIKGIAVFKVKVKEKQLLPLQIAQLLSSSEIKLIIETLSTGSLPLAAALINAYPSDGVLVTEEDKQAVLQAIG